MAQETLTIQDSIIPAPMQLGEMVPFQGSPKQMQDLIHTGSYKVLYCYTIDSTKSHHGLSKVGDATIHGERLVDIISDSNRLGDSYLYTSDAITEAAHKRIRQQTNTAGIAYKLEWAYLAVTPQDLSSAMAQSDENGGYRVFRDQELHRHMERFGFSKERPDKKGKAQEWFRATPEQVLFMLQHFQTGDAKFLELAKNLGIIPSDSTIVLRPEQEEAVAAMRKYLKGGTLDDPRRFLLSAIMRFGKTTVMMQLIKDMPEFKKVLILSHRPQVLKGWEEEADKQRMEQAGHPFASRDSGHSFASVKDKESFTYAASIQDMRGSLLKEMDTTDASFSPNSSQVDVISQNFLTKNEEIFEVEWDAIIVDEGHEGTLTALFQRMESMLKAKNWITLSGTPFNIMDGYEPDAVYEWSYIGERKALEEFRRNNPGETSPWDGSVELNILTYDISKNFDREEYKDVTADGVYFNFRNFFATKRDENGEIVFANPRDVHRLLSLITKDRSFDDDDDKRYMPFENAKMKRILAHTLWHLPSVESCVAMKNLLSNHSYFADFTVVNVAGDNFEGPDALTAVQEAIAENPYTITLTVGRLTTGVTVPEWTGVFLLSNLRSPMLYMQTIFRCKSAGNLPDGSVKEAGYVFDFSFQRTLEMKARAVASSLSRNLRKEILKGEIKGFQEAMEEELRFAPITNPIISADGSAFAQYDAKTFMRKVYGAYSLEIYRNGFVDPGLFNPRAVAKALKDPESVKVFNELRAAIGTQQSVKTVAVDVNNFDISESARALAEKPKEQVKPEESQEWKEAKKAVEKEKRAVGNVLAILRALAARVPLLVFAQALSKFAKYGGAELERSSLGDAIAKAKHEVVEGVIVSDSVDAEEIDPETIPAIVPATVSPGMPCDTGWPLPLSGAPVVSPEPTGWIGAEDAVEQPTLESILDDGFDDDEDDSAANLARLIEQAKRNMDSITLYNFPDHIDDESWREFMPPQVSKDDWYSVYCRFFNPMVFELSCWQVVNHVREALDKSPMERVPYLAEVFATFKSPDKETVLTPWKVVVMQGVETLGGLRWVDMNSNWRASDGGYHSFEEIKVDPTLSFEPEWVSQGRDDLWDSMRSTAFEINSKTALYPLWCAANFYHRQATLGALSFLSDDELWRKIVGNQIFVNARVGYSKLIALRVLTGFDASATANISQVDVIALRQHFDRMRIKDEQQDALWPLVFTPSEFDSTEDRVREIMAMDKKALVRLAESAASQEVEKFDAVMSNPPYQINLTENTGKAMAVWPDFIMVAAAVSKQASFVNPGRWMRGGQGTGLGPIRDYFFKMGHLAKFIVFQDKDLFQGVGIGEMTMELIDFSEKHDSITRGDYIGGEITYDTYLPSEGIDIAISPRNEEIVQSVLTSDIFVGSPEDHLWVGGQDNKTKRISSVSVNDSRADYGIMGPRLYRDTDYFVSQDDKVDGIDYVQVYYSPRSKTVDCRYIPTKEMQDTAKNRDRIPLWKSMIPKTGAETLYRNLGPIGVPISLSTNTWMCRSFSSLEEVEGFNSYLQTYFYRYLVSIRATSHNALANVHRWVPDLSDVENPRTGKMGYESDWTDDDLRILFKDVLTDDDWRYIKAQAIATDNGRGDYEAGYELPKPYNWDELHPGEEWSGKRWSLTLEDEKE